MGSKAIPELAAQVGRKRGSHGYHSKSRRFGQCQRKAETNQWLRSKARHTGDQPSQAMFYGALGAGFRGCYQSHGLQRLANWYLKVSSMGPSPHDASPRWRWSYPCLQVRPRLSDGDDDIPCCTSKSIKMHLAESLTCDQYSCLQKSFPNS